MDDGAPRTKHTKKVERTRLILLGIAVGPDGALKTIQRANRIESNRIDVESNRTEPNRTEPNRIEPNRTESNRQNATQTNKQTSKKKLEIISHSSIVDRQTWLSPLAPWSTPFTQSPATNTLEPSRACRGRLSYDPGLKHVTA